MDERQRDKPTDEERSKLGMDKISLLRRQITSLENQIELLEMEYNKIERDFIRWFADNHEIDENQAKECIMELDVLSAIGCFHTFIKERYVVKNK